MVSNSNFLVGMTMIPLFIYLSPSLTFLLPRFLVHRSIRYTNRDLLTIANLISRKISFFLMIIKFLTIFINSWHTSILFLSHHSIYYYTFKIRSWHLSPRLVLVVYIWQFLHKYMKFITVLVISSLLTDSSLQNISQS